mgnify:CR=1 FL=1
MKKYTKILSLIAVLICIVFMSGCAKNITVEYQIDDTVITTQQYAKNNKIKLINEYRKITNIYKKALNEIDLPLCINPDVDIENVTKLLKIKLETKNEILDNLLLLIDLEKVLNKRNILFFINLKQYLTSQELLELYKYSIYQQVPIILIDSQSYGTSLKYEKKLIVDSELDEFVLQS